MSGIGRKKVERICEDLLEGVDHPPTNLIAVGQKLGVTSVVPEPGLPYSGALHHKPPGEFAIVYSPSRRERFTIAHELGHAYLKRSDSRPLNEESFCDHFAGELLMPSRLLRDELQEPLNIERLRGLAKRFGVTLHAACVRCALFTPLAAFSADRRGLLWRAGEVWELDDFLQDRVNAVLERGRPIQERVWHERSSGRDSWVLEAEPQPWRETDIFVLLTPAARSSSPLSRAGPPRSKCSPEGMAKARPH